MHLLSCSHRHNPSFRSFKVCALRTYSDLIKKLSLIASQMHLSKSRDTCMVFAIKILEPSVWYAFVHVQE